MWRRAALSPLGRHAVAPSTARGPLAAASAVALAVLGGCGGAVDAQLVASAPERVEPSGAIERYELGPEDIQLQAEVTAGPGHTLRFERTTGTLQLAPAVPEASSLQLVVEMASATASVGAVADVAKARFLHVEKHPEARMSTRSFRRVEEGLLLYADFTLHGQTRTVAVPATLAVDACRVRFLCEFTIQRSDFGVVDEGSLEVLVSDDVEIRVSLDVARTQAPATCAAASRAD